MSQPPVQAPTAQSQRRDRQRDRTRREILDAAEALLLEAGYEALSMRRLAHRCGYTAPTLYHYFEDKPHLLDALLDDRFDQVVARLRRVPASPDAADYLCDLARAYMAYGLENPTFYRLLMTPREDETNPPRAAEEALALMEAPVLQLAQEGRLRHDGILAVTQCVGALAHGIVSLCHSRPDYPWANNLIETALDGMLHGLIRSAREPGSGAGP